MFNVNLKDFVRAGRIALSVQEKHNTIPVLGATHVETTGAAEITVTATDLDMLASIRVPAAVPELGGAFLLDNLRSFLPAVNAAGGEGITFDSLGNRCTATAGSLTRTTISRDHPDDFPQQLCSTGAPDFTATLSVEALRQIERIAVAISDDETRYYLHGINMRRLDGWTYRFAATNGHRLLMVDIPLPDAAGKLPENLILPRKYLRLLFQHFRRAGSPIAMTVARTLTANREEGTDPPKAGNPVVSVSAEVDGLPVTLTGKTIDGTYPDYERVVPRTISTKAIFNTGDLRRAILAVSAGMRPTPAVALSFDASGARLDLAYGIDGVTASYRLPCKHNMPPGLRIGFRSTYMLDQLAARGGQDLVLHAEDALAPTLWRAMDDPAITGVLMPMRLPEPVTAKAKKAA